MDTETILMAAAADLTPTEVETLMLTSMLVEDVIEITRRTEREQCALVAERCGAHNVAALIRSRDRGSPAPRRAW